MTRLVRLLLPLALSVLSTGAVVMACHHGDVPAAPRADPTDPSGKPITTIGPSTEIPADAGVDSLLGAPAASASGQLSPHASRGFPGGAEGAALLASQPMTPAPSGAPAQPGAPSPSQPSPGAPGSPPIASPQPAPPQPGAPAQPGAPSPSPSPSSPSPGTPRPGAGSGSGSSSPGPSAGPTDAGVSDAGLPQLPPIVDAGFPSGDAGMQPILRRK